MKTFSERVVEIALSIPKGRVTTYGRIARAAGGGAMASQSITNILGKAYDSGITDIPFHRIVYADGRIWVSEPARPPKGAGGKRRRERMKLYKKEGIRVDENDRVKDFRRVLVEFS